MSDFQMFLFALGAVAAVIGALSTGVLVFVFIYVRVLGFPLGLYWSNGDDDGEPGEEDE